MNPCSPPQTSSRATTEEPSSTCCTRNDERGVMMDKKLPTEDPQGHSTTKSGNITVATTIAIDNKDQQASCSSEAAKSNDDATKNIHDPKVPVQPVPVTHPPTITQPQKMTIMNHGNSSVNPHFAENNHNNWNIVSPMVHLSETCEAYQRHVQTFVKMGIDHGGRSKFYQTRTLLDHMVSLWIEKGGCFMNQGQFLNIGPQLLHFIILNHWNPCMDHCQGEETGEAKTELLQRKSNTCTKVLLHGTTTTNNNDDDVTKNDKVVTLGSDSFSDEFLYHIYAYAKVHAKNINSTMARYRNSKRCLKHWNKKGGKVMDGNGFELTHQEAMCVMEGILWRHYNEWLNEYIVI